MPIKIVKFNLFLVLLGLLEPWLASGLYDLLHNVSYQGMPWGYVFLSAFNVFPFALFVFLVRRRYSRAKKSGHTNFEHDIPDIIKVGFVLVVLDSVALFSSSFFFHPGLLFLNHFFPFLLPLLLAAYVTVKLV